MAAHSRALAASRPGGTSETRRANTVPAATCWTTFSSVGRRGGYACTLTASISDMFLCVFTDGEESRHGHEYNGIEDEAVAPKRNCFFVLFAKARGRSLVNYFHDKLPVKCDENSGTRSSIAQGYGCCTDATTACGPGRCAPKKRTLPGPGNRPFPV